MENKKSKKPIEHMVSIKKQTGNILPIKASVDTSIDSVVNNKPSMSFVEFIMHRFTKVV